MNMIRHLTIASLTLCLSITIASAMTNKECKGSGGGCMPVVSGEDAECGMCLHTLKHADTKIKQAPKMPETKSNTVINSK